MTYIATCDNHHKRGWDISRKLNMDYIYTMKLFREMYQKGWIQVHKYEGSAFFDLTDAAPIKKAKELLTDEQTRLNVDRK